MLFRWIAAVALTSLFLTCCSVQPTHWTVDAIAAGDEIFNSSRLRYTPLAGDHPLIFEMIKMGDQIDSYISLSRFRLKPKTQVKVLFTLDEGSFEEQIAVHEGGMRLALSKETTDRVIQALQTGQKIAIILDDFEEVLDPAEFSSSFEKFIGEAGFFQTIFKGPLP